MFGGHRPSPGLQAVAAGHSAPVPLWAAVSVHVLVQSTEHSDHVPIQSILGGIQLSPSIDCVILVHLDLIQFVSSGLMHVSWIHPLYGWSTPVHTWDIHPSYGWLTPVHICCIHPSYGSLTPVHISGIQPSYGSLIPVQLSGIQSWGVFCAVQTLLQSVVISGPHIGATQPSEVGSTLLLLQGGEIHPLYGSFKPVQTVCIHPSGVFSAIQAISIHPFILFSMLHGGIIHPGYGWSISVQISTLLSINIYSCELFNIVRINGSSSFLTALILSPSVIILTGVNIIFGVPPELFVVII